MVKWTTEDPYEDIRKKVTLKKNPGSNPGIKKVKASTKRKQRNGIGQQVVKVSMNHGRKKNTQ